MEIIDALSKDLGLVVCLNSEAQPRMQAPEALFEFNYCVVQYVHLV
jgi:hypothetical protein